MVYTRDKQSVAVRFDKYVVSMIKTFHEFLRSSTNVLSNNMYSEIDNTVKLLSPLIKNDKIVILVADKNPALLHLIVTTSGKLKIFSKKVCNKVNNRNHRYCPERIKAFPGFSLQTFKKIRTLLSNASSF